MILRVTYTLVGFSHTFRIWFCAGEMEFLFFLKNLLVLEYNPATSVLERFAQMNADNSYFFLYEPTWCLAMAVFAF